MNAVTVIAHPLLQHNLTRLRARRTGPEEFRRSIGEMAALLVFPGLGDAGDRLFGV